MPRARILWIQIKHAENIEIKRKKVTEYAMEIENMGHNNIMRKRLYKRSYVKIKKIKMS